MSWWALETSGAVIIARAMPPDGQVVCVGGIARVAVAVPAGVNPLVTGDGIPGAGDVCLVVGITFELQAGSRNSRIKQPDMKGKL